MANVVVVGAQWGDEGKGKVIDVLTTYADVVVRYAGGANAGHTLVVGDQRLVMHLLPSGVIHPGKQCLLGAGMVIDPEALLEELRICREQGLTAEPQSIRISHFAHVIFPYHKQLDGLVDQGSGAIGTTRRGIGPAYADKMSRRGVQLWQLTDRDTLQAALSRALPYVSARLAEHGAAPVDEAALIERYADYGQQLARYLTDVSQELFAAQNRGEQVLFEGAQGTLLDIDYGTYPYVTSSNTIAGGACTGAGIGPTRIDAVVGTTKAYQTRVGNGPFPTELTDAVGEALRDRGQEYGATTGRPRRCGWLDMAALRRAVRLNGLTGLAITKLDVLQGISPLRICTGYRVGDQALDDLPPGVNDVTPIYEELPGFTDNIRGATRLEDLPATARRYLDRVLALAGVPLTLLSVGPRRSETIIVDNPFGDQ